MKSNNSQSGMSVIELMFCAAITLLAILVIANLLVSGSKSAESAELGQKARIAADDALDTLGSQPSANLVAGGSFRVVDLSTIELIAQCDAATCDYVSLDPNSEAIVNQSPANGYALDAMPSHVSPNNILLRRWRIEDIDSELNLKRITVAVMTDKNSTFPLRIETAIVGLNR